jgi:hypothetical protein
MISQVHDRVWRDLGYAVRATTGNFCEGRPLEVQVKVFEIVGYGSDNGERDSYARKGATTSQDETEDMAEAEVFLAGHIRWDGAAHLWPAEYWCLGGRRNAVSTGAMLVRLYDLAAELMPESAEDLE